MHTDPSRPTSARGVNRRPEAPDDEPFLFRLYASTRAEELNVTGWDAATREGFLRMQFQFQRAGYRAMFPAAEYSVVVAEGTPIGRLVIDRTDRGIRVVDIALLPEHCGRGIGTSLLQNLLQEAASSALPVRLQVIKDSREIRVYARLGFRKIGASGFHEEMEWQPPS